MTFNSRKTNTYGTKGQCYTCGCDKENGHCTNPDCKFYKEVSKE